MAAFAGCARPCPTSASRCCCALRTRWATRPIRTTSCASSSPSPPSRASISSAFSTRSTGCRTCRWPWKRCGKTDRICEAAVCYTGDILDPARDKYPLDYYMRMAKELERWVRTSSPSRIWRGCVGPTPPRSWSSAASEEIGIPDPLPHARHQRHERGVDSQGGRSRRRRGRRCSRVDERHDESAEPELDCRGARPHVARNRARPRRAESVLGLLGGGSLATISRSTTRRTLARPRCTCTRCPAGSTRI